MATMRAEINKLISERDVAKFNDFVASLDARSSFWGGRWLYSGQKEGAITANDLVRAAWSMFYAIKHDQTKKKEFAGIIHLIEEVDARSSAEMSKRNCLTKLLDVARRYFGRFSYDRTRELDCLAEALLHHPLLPYRASRSLRAEFHNIPHTNYSSVNPIFSSGLKHFTRNRYAVVVPYSANRFKAPGHIDYINASLILDKTAIATQAPLNTEREMANFWKMAHLSGSSQIVMVTNLREGRTEKADQYWPELNQTRNLQQVSVRCTSEDIVYKDGDEAPDPYIICRQFEVQYQGQTRLIEHYHLMNWMDNSVVSVSSLSQLVTKIKAPSEQDPVIVHCSAGIGRTGTFLAAQHLFFNHLKNNVPLTKQDLFNLVHRMRQHPHGRVYMVSTEQQYALIWRCLERLAHLRTL